VLTIKVEVPVPPDIVAVLKLHVGGTAVVGVTAQVRATLELKLPTGVMVTCDVAEAPGTTVAGDKVVDVKLKDGLPPVTIRLTVAVWTKVPAVAVIVKLEVVSGVEVLVDTVKGALTAPELPADTETEVEEHEAPDGKPEHVTVTFPLNPAWGVT
jgi:hypothetical protein